MTESDAVGVIGVGTIGGGFVDRLAAADRPIVCYDVDRARTEYAIERGGEGADSPAAVARRTDRIVVAVPGSAALEETMEGEEGLLGAMAEGTVVIDATTTRVETSREYGERCEAVGATYVDAPITGGSPRPGMHMMIGASEAGYEAARPLLDDLADDHTLIGAVGEATTFKLAIQLRYAGQEAVDAEVVEFLRDNDVDPAPLREFLEFDLTERYLDREFAQEGGGLGGLAIWHKDVGYAHELARESDTALPLSGVIHEAYKATTKRDLGEAGGDSAQLLTYWELLNDAADR